MNSASRLLAIASHFKRADPGRTIMEAWKAYLDEDPTAVTDDEVFSAVQAMLGEITVAHARLKDVGAPDEPFATCATKLRNSFSPTQLAQQWKGHRDSMTANDIFINLTWATWALSKFDEDDVDADSFASLRASLDELEQALDNPVVPSGLRMMLERQTLAMRAALKVYKIQGIGPLRNAVTQAVGEMATAPQAVVQEMATATPEARGVLTKGLRIIGKAAELADKGSKLFKFSNEIYELGTKASNMIHGFLPNAPS